MVVDTACESKASITISAELGKVAARGRKYMQAKKVRSLNYRLAHVHFKPLPAPLPFAIAVCC